MRHLVVLISFLLLAPAAHAACSGTSLMERMQADHPEAFAEMQARADAIPNGRGRFWRIEADGTEPSHLFGTYHAAEAVETVPSQVWKTLEGAREAFFEMSPAEQDRLEKRVASDPEFSMSLQGAGWQVPGGRADRALVESALTSRGLTLEAARKFKPWLIFTLLGFPACHIQGLSAGEVPLDLVMAQRAEKARVRVDGLETYEQALGTFGALGTRDLTRLVVAQAALVPIENDVWQTMRDLYAEGEIGQIREIGDLISLSVGDVKPDRPLQDRLAARLLDKRNALWMPAIVRAVRRGNAFIAVGALHLPGEAGLIELLRAKGFEVTPLS